jgi:hypothetical protein
MGNLVKTTEILEALEIDDPPITADTLVDLEKTIQESWMERFNEYKDSFEKTHEYLLAEAKICRAVQSALRNNDVDIPSLRKNVGLANAPELDEDAVIPIIDRAIHYIEMGRAFERLIEGVKENPAMSNAWDNFMLMAKMAKK